MAVKDIEASKLFYEKPGFTVFAGDQSQNWLILKNGDHAIGLFQGMFDKNILTFNPLRDPEYLMTGTGPTWGLTGGRRQAERAKQLQELFWLQLELKGPETYISSGDRAILATRIQELYERLIEFVGPDSNCV